MSMLSFMRGSQQAIERQFQRRDRTDRRPTAIVARRSSAIGRACTEILESRRLLSTTLVSTNFTHLVSANGDSVQAFGPFITDDGRLVAFESDATNITTQPTTGTQVFIKDRLSGTASILSIDKNNLPFAGNSIIADMSPDGRYVLFFSDADADVIGGTDSNGLVDLYLRDRTLNQTFLISQNSGGDAVGVNPSLGAYISDDGNFVGFVSDADDAGSRVDENAPQGPAYDDSNGSDDVFVRDRAQNLTLLVTEGKTQNSSSTDPGVIESFGMSADGGTVVISTDMELTAADTDKADTGGTINDVYVRKVLTGVTSFASGVDDGATSFAVISDDGSTVAFQQSGGTADPHVVRATGPGYAGRSITPDGGVGGATSGTIGLNSDGTFVYFRSDQTDIIDGITTSGTNLFRYDASADVIELASLDFTGATQAGNFGRISVSDDGRYVTWASDGTGGAPGITDYGSPGQINVYMRDMGSDQLVLINVQANDATAAGAGDAFSPVFSADVKLVAYFSDADDLVTNDSNGLADVFTGDTPPPLPILPYTVNLVADNVLFGGSSTYDLYVTYIAPHQVLDSTLDDNDIVVVAPGVATPIQATLVSTAVGADNRTVMGHYRIVPPGGVWDLPDNGTYQVQLKGRQVADRQGRFFPAQTIGQFNVTLTQQTANGATATYSATEGPGATATLTVKRIGDTSFPATITYLTYNGTAIAGSDYVPDGGVLNFAGGGSQNIVISLINDAIEESIENFSVLLSGGTVGADFVFVVNGQEVAHSLQAVVNITDDDDAGVVEVGGPTLPPEPPTVDFGSNAQGELTITVPETTPTTIVPLARPAGSSTLISATVAYTVYAGPGDTAEAHTGSVAGNFIADSGRITFDAGSLTPSSIDSDVFGHYVGDLLVHLFHDFKVTGDLTFRVVLSDATSGLVIGSPVAHVIVQNMDSSVQFASPNFSYTDDAGIVNIPVTRVGNLGPQTTVPFTFSGTAIQDTDYTLPDGNTTIVFAPNSDHANIRVQINPKTFVLGQSTSFAITLGAPTVDDAHFASVLGTPSQTTVSIANTDNVKPAVQTVGVVTSGRKITGVTLTFNKALTTTSAESLTNYTLFSKNKNGRLGKLLKLKSASYDPATMTVTLTPAKPLKMNQLIHLTVNAAPGQSTAITDQSNNNLAENFTRIIGVGTSLSYTDLNGDLVTLTLKRGGTINLIYALDGNPTVDLLDTTAGQSVLSGKIAKRKNAGDGHTTLATVHLNGATNALDPSKFTILSQPA